MRSLFNPHAGFLATREIVGLLTRHRQLVVELARREITDRYAGQLIGVFWSFGHPFILMAVYVFVFGFVFQVRLPSTAGTPPNYVVYLLSGLIPWLAVNESLNKSCTVVIQNAGLVKQVIFPIEALPVKGVLASVFTEGVFLLLLAGLLIVQGHGLAWTWALLPALLSLQILMLWGIGFALSAIGVFFRDMKDVMLILTNVGIYITPILYLPGMVPAKLRVILYLNPFTYLVQCYQDVCFLGQIQHPWAWLVITVMSFVSFYVGYRLFAKLKPMFGNVL